MQLTVRRAPELTPTFIAPAGKVGPVSLYLLFVAGDILVPPIRRALFGHYRY
jgi:hypothetical protein